MITEITRSHIRIRVGDRTVTIQGEAYLPGYGSPDFVIYENSIRHWDPPNENIEIDEITRKEILELLGKGLEKKKLTFEVE